MITRNQIKKQLNRLLEHFEYGDILGLSALIFGLVLSSPSTNNNAKDSSSKTQNQQEKTLKGDTKKKKALTPGPDRLKKVAQGSKSDH